MDPKEALLQRNNDKAVLHFLQEFIANGCHDDNISSSYLASLNDAIASLLVEKSTATATSGKMPSYLVLSSQVLVCCSKAIVQLMRVSKSRNATRAVDCHNHTNTCNQGSRLRLLLSIYRCCRHILASRIFDTMSDGTDAMDEVLSSLRVAD